MQYARWRPKSNPLKHRGLLWRAATGTAENHRHGWISTTTASEVTSLPAKKEIAAA
jgi:hypothetical protein